MASSSSSVSRGEKTFRPLPMQPTRRTPPSLMPLVQSHPLIPVQPPSTSTPRLLPSTRPSSLSIPSSSAKPQTPVRPLPARPLNTVQSPSNTPKLSHFSKHDEGSLATPNFLGKTALRTPRPTPSTSSSSASYNSALFDSDSIPTPPTSAVAMKNNENFIPPDKMASRLLKALPRAPGVPIRLDNLPAEVIDGIFRALGQILVLPLPQKYAVLRSTLSLVCQRWRKMVLSMPWLWSILTVRVSDITSRPSPLDIATYLSRSDTHPLTLTLVYQKNLTPRHLLDAYPNAVYQALQVFLKHCHHWRSISLDLVGLPPKVEFPPLDGGRTVVSVGTRMFGGFGLDPSMMMGASGLPRPHHNPEPALRVLAPMPPRENQSPGKTRPFHAPLLRRFDLTGSPWFYFPSPQTQWLNSILTSSPFLTTFRTNGQFPLTHISTPYSQLTHLHILSEVSLTKVLEILDTAVGLVECYLLRITTSGDVRNDPKYWSPRPLTHARGISMPTIAGASLGAQHQQQTGSGPRPTQVHFSPPHPYAATPAKAHTLDPGSADATFPNTTPKSIHLPRLRTLCIISRTSLTPLFASLTTPCLTSLSINILPKIVLDYSSFMSFLLRSSCLLEKLAIQPSCLEQDDLAAYLKQLSPSLVELHLRVGGGASSAAAHSDGKDGPAGEPEIFWRRGFPVLGRDVIRKMTVPKLEVPCDSASKSKRKGFEYFGINPEWGVDVKDVKGEEGKLDDPASDKGSSSSHAPPPKLKIGPTWGAEKEKRGLLCPNLEVLILERCFDIETVFDGELSEMIESRWRVHHKPRERRQPQLTSPVLPTTPMPTPNIQVASPSAPLRTSPLPPPGTPARRRPLGQIFFPTGNPPAYTTLGNGIPPTKRTSILVVQNPSPNPPPPPLSTEDPLSRPHSPLSLRSNPGEVPPYSVLPLGSYGGGGMFGMHPYAGQLACLRQVGVVLPEDTRLFRSDEKRLRRLVKHEAFPGNVRREGCAFSSSSPSGGGADGNDGTNDGLTDADGLTMVDHGRFDNEVRRRDDGSGSGSRGVTGFGRPGMGAMSAPALPPFLYEELLFAAYPLYGRYSQILHTRAV